MRLTQLKLRRLEAGKLQFDTAAAAKIGVTRYSQLENGWRSARPEEYERIALALQVPVDALKESSAG